MPARDGLLRSGYRGSPLGGLDQALSSARKYLKEDRIHFVPV
ncbi:MAG: hypothetical protein WDN69_33020 [Aliidongia sp.]